MKAAANRAYPFSSLGQGIVELLFYLPVLLIAAIYLLPESAVWSWLLTLPLCYWFAAMLIERFPRLRLIVKILSAISIGVIHACLIIGAWTGELQIIPIIICGLAGTLAVERGMSASLKSWTISFSNSRMLTGVITYIAVQPLKLTLIPKLMNYNGIILTCGIAAVIFFFFFANERHLNSETIESGKSAATKAFKRQNRVMMFVIIAIISIIALFRNIQKAIESFVHSIIARIMQWFNRPVEDNPPAEPQANEPQPMFPAEEPKEPAEWLVLLEQIIKFIFIVLLVVGILVLLFFLAKKLYKWITAIVAKLLERSAEGRKVEEGFTDEVEQLMTLNNLREQMGNRLKGLFPKKRSHAKDWNELTNAEKIRALYAQNLRSDGKVGYEAQPHLTPRETVADREKWKNGKLKREGMQGFIDVYEQVRYGEGNPNDKQVADYKKLLGEEKN
ncbi:hypothetical protein FHS15_001823 [Paenibacillus castaneae]|uniref:hypothetical protein n=1 Tax=Paenibacillus castaneae TaxID=474957 RepID=UPI000C99B7E7|nr:hypothetical protein [Paenibacillus castaneae]NIK76698.1 hypothetical protein [Paenibacillus castaneae]